ncbi:hypothetical protein [Nocardiopsis quinghaiensis]|uniref:hypothetical protein n=1 Tax=Nocardiopsis quinghaiensis TaxID=464995 RepID=UPI00123B5F68|nr:hypothetical protein [Nocardiopsis quinghaiensis]
MDPQISDKPIVVTPAETRERLLEKARRKKTPLRRGFVQAPPGSDNREGPLAQFVSNSDRRGLLAYLLVLAVTSAEDSQDGWTTTRDSLVWARALDFTETATESSARTAVRKAFARLEERKLLICAHTGKSSRASVTLLREDGSGTPYTHPGKKEGPDAKAEGRYFQISNRLWTDGYVDGLGLPAIAMLLVLLAERGARTDALRLEQMPDWYGWSADSAARGLKQLEEAKIVTTDKVYRKEPLLAQGWTAVNTYAVEPPFGPTRSNRSKGGDESDV